MSSGTLNFNRNSLITGINVIGGELIWTDDRNEPRAVNIDTFRSADHSSETTEIYGRRFQGRDITVLRPRPTGVLTAVPNMIPGSTEFPFIETFPRFSYRWRYPDNKYSPFAPFTSEVFGITGTSVDEQNNFLQGINTQMFNAANTITLSGFALGGDDVEALDILYTESISSTIYVIETITITDTIRTAGSISDITITSRTLNSALPANQLSRQFDNVPRMAKAQEITANRLIYANYLQNYNQPSVLNSTLNFNSTRTGLYAQPTIKTDRTYQIGVTFSDPLGRKGALIPAGSITIPFFNDGFVSLTSTLNDLTAPSWSSTYQYHIKDTSGPHYNLVTTDSYNDGSATNNNSTYIWLAFASRDRNKIFGGTRTLDDGNTTVDPISTVLIPRRHTHGNTDGTIFEGKSRHPVLEIENEAPQIVLDQILASGDDGTGDPSEDTLELRAQRTNGRFFVKVRRATDTGSGGGAFLSSGQSTLSVDASAGSTTTRTYRVTSLLDPTDFTVPGSITYTPAGSTTPTTIIIGPGQTIDLTTTDTGAPVQSVALQHSIVLLSESASTVTTAFGGTLEQIYFETEPLPNSGSNLDLYWEASSGEFSVEDDFGNENDIIWSNAIGFRDTETGTTNVGVYVEEQRIYGGFNTVQLSAGVRVDVPQENYEEERRSYGLIYSGLFNDRTNVNRLNEFIASEGITKELEPNYGSIQKLHTRDTDLIALNESKVFRILADKDQLTNVDGTTGNVVAANVVLGQTTPFIGEYGIGTNPESFATYGHNMFFSDANKGVILQLTPINGQFFEISTQGMSDFFRDRLGTATKIVGGFDDYFNNYVVSIQGYDVSDSAIDANSIISGDDGNQTIIYDISTRGWISRASYTPEEIITLNNQFYTWNNGRIYLHNSNNSDRNNFYGDPYNSEVEVIFNTQPSVVKDFVTLGYEGSNGWTAPLVSTDQENSSISGFVEKEGKYFSAIVGTEPIYDFVNGVITDTGLTREKGGIKGFYAPIRFSNSEVTEQELFAINTKFFISSN